MNVWAAVPFIAAAVLGGGAGVHTTAVDRVAATPAPAVSIANGAPSPVLHQVGPTWETTVLLSDARPGCGDVKKADYWLAITAPYQVIHGTALAPKPAETTGPATGAPTDGSSCQVTVTFPTLGQMPQTATLVVDQPGTSTPVTLAVSRNVNLTDYLGIPAIAGAVIALLSLLLSALIVWRYDRKRKDPYGLRDWLYCLDRPILGSGAWTANDSWATNISTGLVVVATILGATTAASSLIPGVALDRFSIVNIAAGFFTVAGPVVFGILYSQFTARSPGLAADSTVMLPSLRAATICVPAGASVTVAADTTIVDGSARWAIVRGGGTYQVPPGTSIQLLTGVQGVAEKFAQAVEPEVANMLAQAVAYASVEAAARNSVQADAPSVAHVVEQALVQAGIYAPAGSLAGVFDQKIDRAVRDALRDGVHGHLVRFTLLRETITPDRVTDETIEGTFAVDRAGVLTAVQTGIQAARRAAAAETGRAATAGVPAARQAFLLAIEQALADSVTQADVLDNDQPTDAIRPAVSAAITGTAARTAADKLAQDAVDALGCEVPSRIAADGSRAISQALIPAIDGALDGVAPRNGDAPVFGAMAYAGGSDIGVLPGSTLRILASAGTSTIPAGDVLAQPSAPPGPPDTLPGAQQVPPQPTATPAPPDARLTEPLVIDAAGGAKVTVTGAADITLRSGTAVSAPRGSRYDLHKERQFLAPQGTNLIVANLRIILIVNIFTMFGIGAELGIAAVLAGFSDATGHGRGYIFLALIGVAALVIWYAATATRAMAAPQPGSSTSSQTGTSFTL